MTCGIARQRGVGARVPPLRDHRRRADRRVHRGVGGDPHLSQPPRGTGNPLPSWALLLDRLVAPAGTIGVAMHGAGPVGTERPATGVHRRLSRRRAGRDRLRLGPELGYPHDVPPPAVHRRRRPAGRRDRLRPGRPAPVDEPPPGKQTRRPPPDAGPQPPADNRLRRRHNRRRRPARPAPTRADRRPRPARSAPTPANRRRRPARSAPTPADPSGATGPASDPDSHPVLGLDDVVHQRVRLGILTIAHEARRVEFGYLRSQLELTAGNLSKHLTCWKPPGSSRSRRGTRESAAAPGSPSPRPARPRSRGDLAAPGAHRPGGDHPGRPLNPPGPPGRGRHRG